MLIGNCDINDEFDKPHTQTQISEAQTTGVYFLANGPMGWLKQHYFWSWGGFILGFWLGSVLFYRHSS